jgi:hypothetical protein
LTSALAGGEWSASRPEYSGSTVIKYQGCPISERFGLYFLCQEETRKLTAAGKLWNNVFKEVTGTSDLIIHNDFPIGHYKTCS